MLPQDRFHLLPDAHTRGPFSHAPSQDRTQPPHPAHTLRGATVALACGRPYAIQEIAAASKPSSSSTPTTNPVPSPCSTSTSNAQNPNSRTPHVSRKAAACGIPEPGTHQTSSSSQGVRL